MTKSKDLERIGITLTASPSTSFDQEPTTSQGSSTNQSRKGVLSGLSIPSVQLVKTLSAPGATQCESEQIKGSDRASRLRETLFGTLFQWRNWVCFAFYLSVSMLTGHLIRNHVPLPYMDEIFHIDQAQRYCRKEWFSYHPKLTTPPGLYLLSQPLTAAVGCDVNGLRLVNHLLGIVLYWVGACLARRPESKGWTQPLAALATGLSPIGLFFHHLYYTDTASTLTVFLGILLANHGHHWTSALIGLLSLTIRQTNVVWVVFCLVWGVCTGLVQLSPSTKACRALLAVPRRSRDFATLLFNPGELFQVIRMYFVSLVLQVALPYILVIASFNSFLIWNGGVVLGDKANHVAGLHLPQLGYYVVYASAMLWPHLLEVSTPMDFASSVLTIASNLKSASLLAGLLAFATTAIHNFTVHHPFLLSDNRHITFYIWKNFFRVHPFLPYLYAPVYVAAGWGWFVKVVQASHHPCILWLGYAAAVVLTLVPSPLLELRYFIPHLAFLRLCLMDTRRHSRAILEITFNLILHSFILYRFILKPYLWEGHPGELQRLMW